MINLSPRSLNSKITVGVVATVMLVCAASFWMLQRSYRKEMVHSLAEATTVQGELIEQSLRHAMHTRSLDLLAEMVQSLGSQRGVENVMILNKKGAIRFSSNPEERGRIMTASDPTCEICHRQNPSVRGHTVIFDAQPGEQVFRNVNPILNSESCQVCHPSTDRLNGILIVDYSLDDIESSLQAGAQKMWLSALALGLAIMAVIFALTRRLIFGRLGALTRAVESIEAGALDDRVDESGSDEISLLSRHVNRMAESLDRSLRFLKEREEFLDAVINSADDGIVVVDERLRVVTANRTYLDLFGAEAQPSDNLPCSGSPLCASQHARDCPARLTFDSGRVTRRIRSVNGDDGGVRHFEIAASPLRHADGRPQVLEIWRDITERRELEGQLARSEQLASLGYLASGLSHEINNPLASITACIDGLRRRLRGAPQNGIPPELPEYLDLIRGEVGRCRDLTNRLRLLSRQPGRSRDLIGLRSIVEETLALVRFEASENSVRIEEEYAEQLAPILADEAHLRQVVLNLVFNAIQAIEGGGTVRVELRRRGDKVELLVSDTGCGIEADELKRIFEPFYSARSNGQGTGLGLFISKILVDQMEGSIQVDSRPGERTCFRVSFPAAQQLQSEGAA